MMINMSDDDDDEHGDDSDDNKDDREEKIKRVGHLQDVIGLIGGADRHGDLVAIHQVNVQRHTLGCLLHRVLASQGLTHQVHIKRHAFGGSLHRTWHHKG